MRGKVWLGLAVSAVLLWVATRGVSLEEVLHQLRQVRPLVAGPGAGVDLRQVLADRHPLAGPARPREADRRSPPVRHHDDRLHGQQRPPGPARRVRARVRARALGDAAAVSPLRDHRDRADLRRLHAAPVPGGRAVVPPAEPDPALGRGPDVRALPGGPRRPDGAPHRTGAQSADRRPRPPPRPPRNSGAAPPRLLPQRARRPQQRARPPAHGHVVARDLARQRRRRRGDLLRLRAGSAALRVLPPARDHRGRPRAALGARLYRPLPGGDGRGASPRRRRRARRRCRCRSCTTWRTTSRSRSWGSPT